MALRSLEGNRFYSQPKEMLEGILRVVSPDAQIEQRELKLGEVRVRKMNAGNVNEVQAYADFLNDPRNMLHFSDQPRNVKELRERTRSPQNHFLIAKRTELNDKGRLVEKVVGGALLSDNKSPENDHWISLVAVDPDKQGQGIGTKLMKGIIDWSYDHPTYQGRKREQLHLGINVGIDGWEKVEKLFKISGFKFFQTIGKEIDYWEVKEPDKEPHLEPDREIQVSFIKIFNQDGTCKVSKADGQEVYETKFDKDGNEMVEFKDTTLSPEERNSIIRKIESSAVKVEKSYEDEEIDMPDGTIYRRIKKPTRRYLFRYVAGINKDHKSWSVNPENWQEFVGTELWSHDVGATEFPKV